jgi:hypothetical protein
MSITNTLETSKGQLQIEITQVQLVENNTKRLLELKATNDEHKFFYKQELRIPVEYDAPTEKDTHAFERKVENMFTQKSLKERGYQGKL